MQKTLILIILIIRFSNSYSHSKEDITDYLKSRIELYSERPSSVEISSCDFILKTIWNTPYSSFKTKMISPMKELLDVMYVNDKQLWITLKFRSKCVSYTEIEDNGSKNLWKYDDEINLFFSKGTLDNEEAKKIVSLVKKLGEICGAKVLKL
jgi:outer membrane lipoprotein-sorting protein